MVAFMEHLLAGLGLLLAWCAFVYAKPDKACRKCSRWVSGSAAAALRPAGGCKATGRHLRLSARLVHGSVNIGRLQLREALKRRREAS